MQEKTGQKWLFSTYVHCTKMDADKSVENTPNTPKLSAQIVYKSPKVCGFDEKRLHWASVVRELNRYTISSDFFGPTDD